MEEIWEGPKRFCWSYLSICSLKQTQFIPKKNNNTKTVACISEKSDIIQMSKIGAIAISVINKLFQDDKSVDSYCQTYQNVYNKIIIKLINNHGGYN